ncbi:MAG: DUF692 family multinuclear iron-containing protein [Rhizobiaceae bacterium]
MLAGLGIGHLPFLHENIMGSHGRFDFVEVTPETYIGGDPLLMREQMQELAPVLPSTCHGIDLSLCSTDDFDNDHLENLSSVLSVVNPLFFSEHLAYTQSEDLNSDIYLPPLYLDAEVGRISKKCEYIAEYFKKPFHLENVPDFLFGKSGIGEGEFFGKLAKTADVGVILNIDSITISARLQNIDPLDLVQSYPADRIISLTVVPEACMNPVIRTMCGGFDGDMLSIVEHCLRRTSAKSVLVQTRYGSNTVESLDPVLTALGSKLSRHS